MRFAAYAGASGALAAGVIIHAFNQRPNFYSAIVYLAQSQACRMILLNLVLLSCYTIVRALQKALYGPLRAIEREQLWDKSWYAITETALAMTTFRDEVGAYFLIMFVGLLGGKVWTWISEGRVEILEQQPPTNPRLFHARMVASLFISELYDLVMLRYCVNKLISQPKPGMMVMFAFEFAVLFITSSSITLRYILSLQEIVIVKKQTAAKLEEKREEIRAQREEAQRLAPEESEAMLIELGREEDVDENDIDVPGWQDKGRWVLFLDLFTDFMKLAVYLAFFTMLILFHGIPIYIIRDVYMTTRSFVKRINDYQKYRNATYDMNTRYSDATAEELARDGTCIICREDMRPWEPAAEPQAAERRPGRPARSPPDERQRPKKLPCGHVLHQGCLKSWLERQQVCPTCRTSVLAPSQPRAGDHGNAHQPPRPGQNLIAPAPGAANGAQAGQQPPNAPHPPPDQPNVRARQFHFLGWRFTFAAGNPLQVRERIRQLNEAHDAHTHAPAARGESGVQATTQASSNASQQDPGRVYSQLNSMEQNIMQEIARLQLSQQQLQNVRRLHNELSRIRLEQMSTHLRNATETASSQGRQMQGAFPTAFYGQRRDPSTSLYTPQTQMRHGTPPPNPQAPPQLIHQLPPQPQVFSAAPQQAAMGPGHVNLPPGLSLPNNWTLLPLQRTATPGGSGPNQNFQPVDLANLNLPAVVPQTTQRHPGLESQSAAPTSSATTPNAPASSTQVTVTNGEPAATSTNSTTNGASTGGQTPQQPSEATDLPDWSISGAEPSGEGPSQTSSTPGRTIDGLTNDAATQGADTAQQTANGSTTSTTNDRSDTGKSRAARVEETDDDLD